MTTTRSEHFNVRLRPEELAKLHALAEDRDETASALIRRFIRERYAARFGAADSRARAKTGHRR
jgi:hypothetical protein